MVEFVQNFEELCATLLTSMRRAFFYKLCTYYADMHIIYQVFGA